MARSSSVISGWSSSHARSEARALAALRRHGVDGDARQVGDLGLGQLLVEAQHDHGPLLGRQRADDVPDRLAALVVRRRARRGAGWAAPRPEARPGVPADATRCGARRPAPGGRRRRRRRRRGSGPTPGRAGPGCSARGPAPRTRCRSGDGRCAAARPPRRRASRRSRGRRTAGRAPAIVPPVGGRWGPGTPRRGRPDAGDATRSAIVAERAPSGGGGESQGGQRRTALGRTRDAGHHRRGAGDAAVEADPEDRLLPVAVLGDHEQGVVSLPALGVDDQAREAPSAAPGGRWRRPRRRRCRPRRPTAAPRRSGSRPRSGRRRRTSGASTPGRCARAPRPWWRRPPLSAGSRVPCLRPGHRPPRPPSASPAGAGPRSRGREGSPERAREGASRGHSEHDDAAVGQADRGEGRALGGGGPGVALHQGAPAAGRHRGREPVDRVPAVGRHGEGRGTAAEAGRRHRPRRS